MTDIKCTKRLQMASLQLFAGGLGYFYNGKYFQSIPEKVMLSYGSSKVKSNKVKFSRMAELHNGKLHKRSYTRNTNSDDFITLGNDFIEFWEYLLAEKCKLVMSVKLQQKNSGEVIVQNDMIRLVGYCKCCH